MAKQLTDEIIDAAIEGFTQQRARIDQKIAELQAIRSGQSASSTATESAPGKRKGFSAASRRKMALAQKARWAKVKGKIESAQATVTPSGSKRKRKMSAAGREAIAEATRKRWEAFRAAKARQEKAATKATRANKSKTTAAALISA